MTEKHKGSCQCGAVRFEIVGDFERFFLCHCGRCRKDTGSAHAANLFSSTARLRWLSGEALAKTYSVPSTRHQKSFCTECGSALPRTHASGGIVVPAGSLDSALGQRPDAHIFFASKAAWDERLQDIRRFGELPG